jgi:hypothetical protein
MRDGTTVTVTAGDPAHESATTAMVMVGLRRQAGDKHDQLTRARRLGRSGPHRLTAGAQLAGRRWPARGRQPHRGGGLAVGFQAEAVVAAGQGAIVMGHTRASEGPMARPTAWSVRR